MSKYYRCSKLACRDGTTLSVQDGEGFYAKPGTTVEINYIRDKDNVYLKPAEFTGYGDGGAHNLPYAYVPYKLLIEFLRIHGGLDNELMAKIAVKDPEEDIRNRSYLIDRLGEKAFLGSVWKPEVLPQLSFGWVNTGPREWRLMVGNLEVAYLELKENLQHPTKPKSIGDWWAGRWKRDLDNDEPTFIAMNASRDVAMSIVIMKAIKKLRG
ncbi:MAG: hypothetical protein KDH96_03300 [Candidatus Riesia sp.]|nr:hypothetical protein [Candidatus Riesia sp.]